MKPTIVGSGSPEAYGRRASSGYLLEVAKDRLLFDCGGGVFDNLLRAGYAPKDITHLFFTHYHSDHMMDYPRLLHAAWDEAGTTPKVFGPPPLHSITEGYFGKNGVLAHDLRARTELEASQQVWVARGGTLPRPWPSPVLTEIAPGFSHAENGWRLRAAEATHAQPFLQCLGFALEWGGKKFVYSGDTGINAEITTLCKNADLLVHWCYRGSEEQGGGPSLRSLCPDPRAIAEMAVSAGVKYLVLSHFRTHMDRPKNYAASRKALRETFGPNSTIAEDLDIFHI